MSTIDKARGAATHTRFLLGVGLVAAIALMYFAARSRAPQMGADVEVFRTVDALYTAVTARDDKLLGQCEQHLQTLQSADKLPTEALRHLTGVIETARAGRWEPAARTLHEFISQQRREGAAERTPKKKGRNQK